MAHFPYKQEAVIIINRSMNIGLIIYKKKEFSAEEQSGIK